MSYVISKLVWAVVSPLNLVAILLLSGVLAWFFCRKGAKTLWFLGAAIFIITGITPVGPNMLASLENRYRQKQAELPKEISGIIILGGTFDADLSAARRTIAVNDSMERVMEGLRLARKFPRAITVFSGGEGGLIRQGRPEAREVMHWLERTGYDPARFEFEDKSRNTWENIKFTQDLMNPGPQEIWIVVTSAYHMPRAMMLFKEAGWPGQVIPWPVDYRTDGKRRWMPPAFDVAGNVYKTDLALHELIGMAAYKLRIGLQNHPHIFHTKFQRF